MTKLAADLLAGSYECMVCYEKVGREVAVWSCRVCFAVFHLHCIKQWAKRAQDGKSGLARRRTG